jgi:uncharacterized oxidoreductase
MPIFKAAQLVTLAADIFHAAGATPEESRIVGEALVEANLEGHDSHGVVRVSEYVGWMEEKLINIGARLEVVKETEAFAVMDGNWGWGQVVGKQAMELGIQKALRSGAVTISVSQCCHLGERRLSANPIAIAIPRTSAPPILVDISTCAIAGGKVTIAHNSGKSVPPGCIVDSEGRPSTNPADFIGPPAGALLPFGGHKGFALSFAGDILAGAISGAGCSRPTTTRVGNSFTATLLDPAQFRGRGAFDTDVDQLVDYVKSSKLAEGFTEILIPGEPERRERERRERDGIPVDDVTWREIRETGERYGVKVA